MEPLELLPRAFFARDALDVAHDLIGRWLRCGEVVVQLTEVEAYRVGDSACHAWKGQTPRNRALFGPPGLVYMYVCYGVHAMLNFVTGEAGQPQGVLVRAARPIAGEALLVARRGRSGPTSLAGPGKITRALDLDLSWNEHPLYLPGGLELLAGAPVAQRLVGPRVGIDYALPEHRDAPWRVAEAGTPWVSVRKTLRPYAQTPQ